MMNLAQYPPQDSPAWKRCIEQRINQLETLVTQLQRDLNQYRNQVGSYPVNPSVPVP